MAGKLDNIVQLMDGEGSYEASRQEEPPPEGIPTGGAIRTLSAEQPPSPSTPAGRWNEESPTGCAAPEREAPPAGEPHTTPEPHVPNGRRIMHMTFASDDAVHAMKWAAWGPTM